MLASFFKKHKTELKIGSLFVLFFLLFRLINLKIIPIFVDEAIYLRWAQIAKNDANWRLISLTDGKQPMMIWLIMMVMKVVKDPLWAGRAVSVMTGLVTMVGLWFLSHLLFEKKRLAFLASLLYLVIPFYFLHDRMAIMDSLLGAWSVWGLFFAILLVKTLRLDVALILGFVLGGGILTKSSGFLTIYMLPFTLLLFDWKNKKWRFNLAKWGSLALVAVLISQGFYAVLRLSPFFHIIAEKNTLFVYPLSEWLQNPLEHLWSNFRGLASWLIGYLSWPVVFLITLALVRVKEFKKRKVLLFLWFAFPFLGLVLFGKTLFPRFVLFMSLPLLILAASFLENLAEKVPKWAFVLILLVVLLFPAWVDLNLLFNPTGALIPERDRGQYITSWTVGYGVNGIVAFAKEKAKEEEIFIGTEGNFGMFPASLELYLWDQPGVTVKGYWPVDQLPEEVLDLAGQKPTFFVFNDTQDVPRDWPLELVEEYPSPDRRFSMKLFQVLANEEE